MIDADGTGSTGSTSPISISIQIWNRFCVTMTTSIGNGLLETRVVDHLVYKGF